MNDIVNFLRNRGIQIQDSNHLSDIIIEQFQQKDKTISALSQQITKYKCEDIKNQKLIKGLQDKITQLAPSISDTGTNFMMASEFKSNFEELMTTSLPTALGALLDRPFLFSKCVTDIFQLTYGTISAKISHITNGIRELLHIDEYTCPKNIIQNKIKLSLIKVLQEFWDKVAPFNEILVLEYTDRSRTIPNSTMEDLNEIIRSQDYLQLRKQLHKIIVFMVIQEKEWEFVNHNMGKLIKYTKKQHTILDGWIKQGENALEILEGLKRDGHMHANLKHFVIPYQQDQKDLYNGISLNLKQVQQNTQHIIQSQKVRVHNQQQSQIAQGQLGNCINRINQVQSTQQMSMKCKNKAEEWSNQGKENCSNYLNKKQKKKNKIKGSLQNSSLGEKSPKIQKKLGESLKIKKVVDSEQQKQKQNNDEQFLAINEDKYSRKKSSTTGISKNLANSHQAMLEDASTAPISRKPFEDLPVSKEILLKKMTKAVANRKSSVGKIVNQHHIINQKEGKEKQNSQNHLNVKAKTKQKLYKDIIKEKLLDDKFLQKSQLISNILHPRSKTDREKKKEQNRPLKIQGNVSKLRQKYIN